MNKWALLIISLFCLGFSCNKYKYWNFESTALNDSSKNEISSSMENLKDKRIDFGNIKAGICLDKKSPPFGYLKIGNNISTVKIKTSFELSGDFLGCLEYVEITDSVDGKLIQKITVKDVKTNKTNVQNEDIYFTELHFDYYDFDDCIDIYILQECGAHGPCYGYYFLYNKIKEKYIYTNEYSNLSEIKVDRKNRKLYDYSNDGTGYWKYSTYTIKNYKLFLIEEESLVVINNEVPELYHYVNIVRNNKGRLVKAKDFKTNNLIEPKYYLGK